MAHCMHFRVLRRARTGGYRINRETKLTSAFGACEADAQMRLTELEKSFQFGMPIASALRCRLAEDLCKFPVATTRDTA